MSRLAAADSGVSPEDANRRTKLLIFALATVVVVALAFWFVIKPSLTKSSASAAPQTTTAPVTSAPKKAVPAKPKATPAPAARPSFGDSTRDPFTPLPAEQVVATVATGTGATTVTVPPVVTPTPSASEAHTVTLVAVSGTTADFTVNGVDVVGSAGSSLMKGLVVAKISSGMASLTYAGKPYAVAVGQTISF